MFVPLVLVMCLARNAIAIWFGFERDFAAIASVEFISNMMIMAPEQIQLYLFAVNKCHAFHYLFKCET